MTLARADVWTSTTTSITLSIVVTALSALICLPGTHAKWVEVENGRIERFHTFMTGEVYAALTGHTVSPGIFEVMVLIGKDESLARIGDQASA